MIDYQEIIKRLKHIPLPEDLRTDEARKSEVECLNELQGDLLYYDCPKCLNKGIIYFFDKELDCVCSKRCTCMDIRESKKRAERSGIESLIESKRFDNFRTDEPFQKAMKVRVERWLRDDGLCLFLGGQSGAGKTHLCSAAAGELILTWKRSVRYMLWRDEAMLIKSLANTSDYGRMVDRLKKADVLYIDDLFKGKNVTAGDVNLAFEIINFRYINRKKLIISTEFLSSEILDIDEALGSRIKEMSKGFIIDILKDRSRNFRLK